MIVGIDFGTSGCRAVVLDMNQQIRAEATSPLPASKLIDDVCSQNPADWWQALDQLMQQLAQQIDLTQLQALLIDGTSSTVLLADKQGKALTLARMYNDSSAIQAASDIANYATLAGGTQLTGQTSPATITGMSNNTTYYFVVTAGDGSTESGASSEVSALVYAPLNDSGITLCGDYAYDDSTIHNNNLDCAAVGATTTVDGTDTDTDPVPAGQDAHYGREVTVNDDSDGHAGFSFTQLDSSGTPLATQSTDYATTHWACVQDNVTGLMWEVKTTDGGLQDKNWSYTWYNSTGVNDGGFAGHGDTGMGITTDVSVAGSDNCSDSSRCDTEKYLADVNATTLCGYSDWRLPSAEELPSLVDSSIAYPGPTIDTDGFPNTMASLYWSSSPSAGFSYFAWVVSFSYGSVGYGNLKDAFGVRLVRGGQ